LICFVGIGENERWGYIGVHIKSCKESKLHAAWEYRNLIKYVMCILLVNAKRISCLCIPKITHKFPANQNNQNTEKTRYLERKTQYLEVIMTMWSPTN